MVEGCLALLSSLEVSSSRPLEGNLPLRGSLRVSEGEGFRGLQRFLEVFRGFQGFFRSPFRDPLRGRFPSQRREDHKFRNAFFVHNSVFRVQETVLLVNHAFARGTLAIFVIFIGSRGLSSKTLVLLVRTQIRHFRRFRQKNPSFWRDKSTVYQKHRFLDPDVCS